MKLLDVWHAVDRPAWTARLIVYVAVMVTISALVQLVAWWLG